MSTCPQCGQTANAGPLRLVQDSCGHRKCRECLLSDEAGCRSCSSPVYTDLRPASCTAPPLPCYSSPTDDVPVTPEHCGDVSTEDAVSQQVLEDPLEEEIQLGATVPTPAPHPEDNGLLTSELSSESGKSLSVTENEVKDKPPIKQNPKKRPHIGLKEHIIFTPGDPPMYHCKICMKSYNNRKSARYHNYCGLPDTFKPHKCDICGQGFVTSGHYSYHMKSHSGALPFLCAICQKGFKQSSKLKRHMKSHEGEKPFKCDVCCRLFSAKHVLKEHMMAHSGNHILSCPICSKRFSSNSCLRKHKLLHADPTHKCDYCDKKFNVKWNLEMHRKTHLRERRHKCKQCNRGFKILSDLKRHATVHLEDGEWVCKVCNIVFRRKDNLVRHMKNIHPESQLQSTNSIQPVKNVSNEPLSDSSGAESVQQSECQSSENTLPADSSQGELSSPISSQAVSVIRGRAVPVIQKMGDSAPLSKPLALESGVLTHDSTSESLLFDSVGEKSSETHAEPPRKFLNSSHTKELPSTTCPSLFQREEAGEDQSMATVGQNFRRESVVCHSDSRGVVHYGSVAYNNVLPDQNEVIQSDIDSLEGSYPSNSSVEPEMDPTECTRNSSSIVRPRVIVEKVQL